MSRIHPITEAMMLRVELHAILEKHGLSDERARAECGLELLKWMSDRLFDSEVGL